MARTKQARPQQWYPGKPAASKRPYHFKPGTVALRQIKKEQASTKVAIPKTNFCNYGLSTPAMVVFQC